MSVMIDLKNARLLARFSCYRSSEVGEERHRTARGRYVDAPSALSHILIGDEVAARIPDAIARGINLGEFAERPLDEGLVLSDVDIYYHEISGAPWKVMSVCYVTFLTEAKDARHRNMTRAGEAWFSVPSRPLGARSFPADTAGAGDSEKRTGAGGEAASFVRAELDEFTAGVAFCWIEVAEGMRVRGTIPASDVSELGLNGGDEFLWSPATRRARRLPETGDENEERQKLREELEELRREFREELQSRDTGLGHE